jgi:hypothetical protein
LASFYIGKASKLAVLNAQVDLNTDKVTLLRQRNIFKYKTDFKVIDVIVVDPTLLLPELTVLAENKIHNSSL